MSAHCPSGLYAALVRGEDHVPLLVCSNIFMTLIDMLTDILAIVSDEETYQLSEQTSIRDCHLTNSRGNDVIAYVDGKSEVRLC